MTDADLLQLCFYARAFTGNYWDQLYWNERRKIGSLPVELNAIALNGSDVRRLVGYIETNVTLEELEHRFQELLPAVYAERDKNLAKLPTTMSKVARTGLDLSGLNFNI
jgi:hypothetical protein